jgi:sarcosine oxidase
MTEQRCDVLVIGAGLTGLAAARSLARRGYDVLTIDQAPVGHADGGSHGSCRIFRLGYEDPGYVRLARHARGLWSELADETGTPMLYPVPQLTFGPQMTQVRDALVRAGAACEPIDASEAARRFPGVSITGPAIVEPDSAVIAADRALAALAELAGEVRTGGAVTAIADDGRRVTVSTSDGSRIEARRVVVCAGPWTAGLLAPAGITVPGTATMEQVSYFLPAGLAQEAADPGPGSPGAASTGHDDGWPALPIVVHYGGQFLYGLPVPGSTQYKAGLHHGGPVTDPGHLDHAESSALSLHTEQAVAEFLPGLRPRAAAVERCVYDNSPDEDFIIDRIGNVVVGAGTSGHGFKFGPLLGEWLTALATEGAARQGAATAEFPPRRFALKRFG